MPLRIQNVEIFAEITNRDCVAVKVFTYAFLEAYIDDPCVLGVKEPCHWQRAFTKNGVCTEQKTNDFCRINLYCW